MRLTRQENREENKNNLFLFFNLDKNYIGSTEKKYKYFLELS